MKKNITWYDFRQAFEDYDRLDNFSIQGLEALYNWLCDFEEDTGEEIELDVIALCCDFTEYGSAEECAANYFDFEGMTYDEETGEELETPEEVEQKALEYLQENTIVIDFPGGVIIQDY